MKSLEDHMKEYGFVFREQSNTKNLDYHVFDDLRSPMYMIASSSVLMPPNHRNYCLLTRGPNNEKITMFQLITDNINDVLKQMDLVYEVKEITRKHYEKR